MAANILDSDLDLAYHLQMQEAMRASLALQPSSSSRPSPTPLPQANDEVSSPQDNVLPPLKRLEQNVADQQRRQAEFRKMWEERDRRIFRKFVTYSLKKIWTLFQDNYHRLYRSVASSSSSPSSSSSTALVDTQCFKLYSKGFLRKQSVGNTKVTVAGAGVAIFDPKDGLVLEVSKNLEPLVDGQVLTSEVAELKALIEGLNQALTLGLKRLTFDGKLYLYVCGKEPQQSRIATLVNEIAHLRRQFTYCKPSLVARNDMKYAAYKFAKDAVLSQITQRLKKTCGICFEDTDFDKMFSVDGCLHRYCHSCMKKHVEVKLLAGMEAKCPHEGCNSKVSIDSCRKFLAPELVEVLRQKMKESSIPVTEKVYCPYPKCSALMSKKEVLKYNKTCCVYAKKSGIRKCTKCHCLFCIKCKVPWHSNMTCDEYKRSEPYSRSEDAMLESLRKTKCWSKCVKCQHMVERVEGCNHITCRCGYQFCYACGAEWKNDAKCHCPMWGLRNITLQRR